MDADAMTMLIELLPDARPKAVQAALTALGLWTRGVRGAGREVLVVLPHSRAVPTAHLLAVEGVADVLTASDGRPLVDAQGPVRCGATAIGAGHTPVLMAGPCGVEDEPTIHASAAEVARRGATFLRGGAFKPRTSPYAFTGHGEPALQWMRDAADAHGLGVVTEVMSERHADLVARHADLLQVGSRNMQNFALLGAVGATGKPVLLKRGRAATVDEWLHAAEHLLVAGASGVVFCERGVLGFDPTTRNLLDLGVVALLAHVLGQPVIVDPSHAVGRSDLVVPLARAALAAGAHGLMVETHPDPGRARSDGPQALPFPELDALAAATGLARAA